MDSPQEARDNQSAYELELLANEFQIEDEVESATEQLLRDGQLGERVPRLYKELGTALSLFAQAGSCAWGAEEENTWRRILIRRLANYSFAALRLGRLGLYDESLAMLRSIAELANLIELFAVDRAYLEAWCNLPPRERWKMFGPAEVRKRIESTGNDPVIDKETYGAFCDAGVHVSPGSARQSHEFDRTVYVRGNFSATGFSLVLNELAIMLSACLHCTGHLVQASPERIQFLTDAGTRLRASATSWMRVTNYQQRVGEYERKPDSSGSQT